MRKIYAFLAAALMSVSVFAAKDVVPSDAVLADYYNQGDVCVCFYVPDNINCNSMVVTGSFNGWKSLPAECAKAEKVEGYDGWYVASFEPEAEPDATKGIQAKPVMLAKNGAFNWDYQVGAATAIRGGVQVVQGGYAGEIDLINYGTDAPNVFTVDAWKKDPCAAILHNYTIMVISDGCNNLILPYIAGTMTSWTDNGWTPMQLDQAKTQQYQAPVYYYSFNGAEGSPYQIVSGLMDPETGLPDTLNAPGWKDEAYMQKLVDEQWVRIPGEDGDNQLTHEDSVIIWDLRVDSLRWARCAPAEPDEYVVFGIKLPAQNCPQAVEIIGTFDDWEGTAMEINPSTDYWIATFQAKASQFFKFRGAGSWDQELEIYNAEEDTWATIADGQFKFGHLWSDDTWKGEPCKMIELDWSDPAAYRWKEPQGIENITLTEKAQKVVVDGVIYIIRNNKMFNVQGTQVR
jgi:hypothetical protein